MLDQNTDRMWYVIGALVIGAGIILLANKAMPEIFANVSKSMEGVTGDASKVASELTVGNRTPVNFRLYSQHTENVGRFYTHGEVIVPSGGGVYLKATDMGLEPNTTYEFGYTFEKLDGHIWGVGGHTDYAFNNNEFYVDGQKMPAMYRSKTAWDQMSDLANEVNEGGKHTILVRFKTPNKLIIDEDERKFDQYDGRIYIQPNRMYNEGLAANVKVTDITLNKVTYN